MIPEVYICKSIISISVGNLSKIMKGEKCTIEKISDAYMDIKLGGPTYKIVNYKGESGFLFSQFFIDNSFISLNSIREHKLNTLFNEI